MKSYKITYIDADGDVCTVTVEASNKQEAKIELKQEYWDVKEIIKIREE